MNPAESSMLRATLIHLGATRAGTPGGDLRVELLLFAAARQCQGRVRRWPPAPGGVLARQAERGTRRHRDGHDRADSPP